MPFDQKARMVQLAAKAASLARVVELSGVDLGEEREVYDWELPKAASAKPKNMRKMYPSLSIYRTPADLKTVPDSGKAMIDYKVTKRTKRLDDAGKETHDYEIEIRSLDPVAEKDTKQPVKGKISPGVPVMGAAKVMLADARRVLGFASNRATNGEFAPTDSGTFTPAQATAAYGHPDHREKLGATILARAVAAAAGSPKSSVAPDESE